MNTIYKQILTSILFILILGGTTTAQAQENTHLITVSGIVKDKHSKKKLEYVSVSILGTNIGTVTNADGEFTLKVRDSLKTKIVEISHIGYANYQLVLNNGQDIENTTVFLTANTNLLEEVVVSTVNPEELVREAIQKKGDNYSNASSLLTGFYRETVQKKRNFINISEAILDIYKTSYAGINTIESDRVQILKGRQLLSTKPSDTLVVKLQGGPTLSTYADIVKNPDLILDPETLSYYKFTMKDPAMINERPHYVVGFEPQVILPYPLYSGELYIDKQSLAFSRAEFSLDMVDQKKATEAILRKKPHKLQFKPQEVSFLITYSLRDGRSYLNYVRNTVRFKCDWKKKWIFSTSYTIVSEMVVTDGKTNNVDNIPRKLAFNRSQSLTDKVTSFYDENFWDDYNIIEPTESLESAIIKLKKQHK